MALTLSVQFLSETYDATLTGTEAEWPPHPARAFCALVSVADPASVDDEALRWLEGQGAPEVVSPAPVGRSERFAYVPTNVVTAKGGHQTYVARTSGGRSWHRTVPSRPIARFVWRDASASPETLGKLQGIARRVAYLGRATCPVLLAFSADVAYRDGLVVHQPDGAGAIRLRVPYPGYLDALRAAYLAGQSSWTIARYGSYGLRSNEVSTAPPAPADAAYQDFLVFGFRPGEGIDGVHAVAVAKAFKAAVLQRLGKPDPVDPFSALEGEELSLLHGHHDGRRRQCAFVPLPFVGSPHATGEILGVGIALSPDLPPPVRVALLQLAGLDLEDEVPRLSSLRVPGLGRRCHFTAPDSRQTLAPSRWQALSTSWVSVLPVVLDWHPKRAFPVDEVVARGCEVAGYPRPRLVEILPAAGIRGAPHVPRRTLARRRGEPAHPAVHTRVEFDRPVPGPLLLGHLRHLGLGLCFPERER